jgi:hypothetical protein
VALARADETSAPPSLQHLLRHAERLAALLFIYDLTPPADDDAACRWLLGRAAEVDRYAESVVDDWAAGDLDEATAARRLAGYIDEMHRGIAAVLHVTAPACCHPRAGRLQRGEPPGRQGAKRGRGRC